MARRLYFHGMLITLISLALGLAVAASGPGVQGRQWLGAHVTGLLMGVLLIACGAVWSSLRLGERAQKAAWFCVVSGAWVGLAGLGIFVPLMKIPQAQAAPGLAPVPGWPNAVVGTAILYVTITLMGGIGTLVVGLRPRAD
jgi:hydroxylaminobenzene mutase